ncbi:MAG: T9SS type A sorting domain-containing protein [Bacteroidota bacterium]
MVRLGIVLAFLAALPASAQIDGRSHEPVVLEASLAPALLGRATDAIAAFRWDGTGWDAIPVQVDERAIVDLGEAYGPMNPFDCESILFCIQLEDQVVETMYTDAGTHVGADPDPALDADDEIALLASDAGSRAPDAATPPAGIVPSTMVEIEISDGAESAFLYLAAHDGALDSAAGQDHVRYTFDLLSGNYLTTYDLAGGNANGGEPVGDALGANPEDTTLETDAYSLHFSDRWILDGLMLGSSDDLLDRRKVQFSPTSCTRHETTGSRGEGAFVVNRDGPVRALRSVVGFNSGPLVQRTDVFYPELVVSTTALRVHSIPGILDVMDYSEAATGMTYRANTTPEGVVIDADPDSDVRGGSPLEWEVVSGAPGTLVIRHDIQTSANLTPTLFWADNDVNPPIQCTGDEVALGQSGPWFDQSIPNTDPRLGSHADLVATRIMRLSPEPLPEAEVETLLAAMAAPLAVTVSPIATSQPGSPEAPPLVSVGPNPTRGSITVFFVMTEPGPVEIAVVDALGRAPIMRRVRTYAVGAQQVEIDTSMLAPGLYLVRLATPGGTVVQRFTRL